MATFIRMGLKWILPLALAALAFGYSFYRRSELSYWDGAVGNWLATLLGIVVGVPVALALERARAKSEKEEQVRADQRAHHDVLTLLRAELLVARQSIEYRTTLGTSVPVEPLRTSAWDAMKATANLRHVSAPSLISSLSEAYRLIEVLAQLEQMLHRTVYGVNVQFQDGENASTKILRNATSFHAPAIAAIAHALNAIESALASPKEGLRVDA